MRALYLAMKSSIDGTASPTNFNMVLYWDNNLVHAGEYLLDPYAQLHIQVGDFEMDILSSSDRVTDICPLKVIQCHDYSKQSS